jgi:hypothetical protein
VSADKSAPGSGQGLRLSSGVCEAAYPVSKRTRLDTWFGPILPTLARENYVTANAEEVLVVYQEETSSFLRAAWLLRESRLREQTLQWQPPSLARKTKQPERLLRWITWKMPMNFEFITAGPESTGIP